MLCSSGGQPAKRERKKRKAKQGILFGVAGAGTFQRTGEWPSVLTLGPVTFSCVYLNRIQLFVAKGQVLAKGHLIACSKRGSTQVWRSKKKTLRKRNRSPGSYHPVSQPAYVTQLIVFITPQGI